MPEGKGAKTFSGTVSSFACFCSLCVVCLKKGREKKAWIMCLKMLVPFSYKDFSDMLYFIC